MNDNWFAYFPKKTNAQLRLFCFANAGDDPTIFSEWYNNLPSYVEVVAIVLPGHYTRANEHYIADWHKLIDATHNAIIEKLDKPYIFFGHSFGARLAYELAIKLQNSGHCLPKQLLVSGCIAPNIDNNKPYMHILPEDEFIKKILGMFGTPLEIIQNKAMISMLEPIIRTNIRLAETWHSTSDNKIKPPIVVFSGIQNVIDTPANIHNWQLYTKSSFKLCTIDSENYFSGNNEIQLLNKITNCIDQNEKIIHQLFE